MQFVNAQEEWLRTFVVVFRVQPWSTPCWRFIPNLTIDDLQSHLDELGLTPTRIALYSLQRSFFRHVELLREAGLLIERTPRAAYIGDDVTPMSDSGDHLVTNENAAQGPGRRRKRPFLVWHGRSEYLRTF